MIVRVLAFLLLTIVLMSNALAVSIIRDEEIESVLKELTTPIYKAAGLPVQDVKLYIVNDEEINAFVPGGYNIFVTTGLLAFSHDPKVFIGVIAHEVGHITSGHILGLKEELRYMKSKMIISMLLGAAAGIAGKSPEAGIGAMMAGSHVSEMQMFKYNRVQESSADSAALKYLERAGVENTGLLHLLEKFKVEERAFANKEFSYMRTHPVSQERISNIKHFNEEHITKKSKFLTKELENRFKRASIKLSAFISSPQMILERFMSKDVDSLYAQSIAYLRLGNFEQSLTKINKAIEVEPKNPFFYELKGQIYFEGGDINNAIQNYSAAYSLDRKAKLIKLSYATALIYANNNIGKAIAVLESISDEDRDNYLIWRELGIAYNAFGNKAKSNTAFAYEAALKGDVQSARKFISISERISPNDPSIKDVKSLIEDVESSIQTEEN